MLQQYCSDIAANCAVWVISATFLTADKVDHNIYMHFGQLLYDGSLYSIFTVFAVST